MNKLLLAAVSTLAISAATSAVAMEAPEGKEKCYGIAKAGANDCASSDNAHSCAGKAKADNEPTEFALVDKGTCEEHGGKTNPPGKPRVGSQMDRNTTAPANPASNAPKGSEPK